MARGGVAFRGATERNYELTDPGTDGQVLTSHGPDTDPTFEDATGGGGGSFSPTIVALTNAEIKALPTTYKTLVAAPGSGKVLVIHRAIVVINAVAGAYTNVETDTALAGITIAYGDWLSDASTFFPMHATAVKSIGFLSPYWWVPTVDILAGVGAAGVPYPPTDMRLDAAGCENLPLKLVAWNDLGDFTGGHASNSGIVYVWHSTVDL